jgi:hypothetical protein
MKTIFLGLMLLASAVWAAPTYSLIPSDGTISGTPGSVIGWGFDIQGDATDWVSIVGASLLNETNPLGTFNSYIDFYGGPVDFAIPPGTEWTMTFSAGPFPVIGTGVGEYAISNTAIIGSQDTGQVVIDYDLFDGDPLQGGNQLNTTPLELLTANGALPSFTINVVSPEPASWIVCAGGLIAIAALRRYKFSKPELVSVARPNIRSTFRQ